MKFPKFFRLAKFPENFRFSKVVGTRLRSWETGSADSCLVDDYDVTKHRENKNWCVNTFDLVIHHLIKHEHEERFKTECMKILMRSSLLASCDVERSLIGRCRAALEHLPNRHGSVGRRR